MPLPALKQPHYSIHRTHYSWDSYSGWQKRDVDPDWKDYELLHEEPEIVEPGRLIWNAASLVLSASSIHAIVQPDCCHTEMYPELPLTSIPDARRHNSAACLSQSSWAHPGGLHSRRLKTRFAAVPSRFACKYTSTTSPSWSTVRHRCTSSNHCGLWSNRLIC